MIELHTGGREVTEPLKRGHSLSLDMGSQGGSLGGNLDLPQHREEAHWAPILGHSSNNCQNFIITIPSYPHM
jgi:hypothetical protein